MKRQNHTTTWPIAKRKTNNISKLIDDVDIGIYKHLNYQYVQENWSLLKIYKIGSNGCSSTKRYEVKLSTIDWFLTKEKSFGAL